MTRRASVRLQVFDGFLCPLVFREEVESMTGKKCVVGVAVPSLDVLLQAKPQREASVAKWAAWCTKVYGAKAT